MNIYVGYSDLTINVLEVFSFDLEAPALEEYLRD